MPSATPDDLVAIFSELGGIVLSVGSVHSVLELVVSLAQQALPGNAAGVTLIEDGKSHTAVHSDEIVRQADDLMYRFGEGPCLSTLETGVPYRIDSMGDETRWPRWAPALHALGVNSSITVPLRVRERVIGAMKVYSGTVGVYTEGDVGRLEAYADRAAIVLGNLVEFQDTRKLTEQLREGLKTRQTIGQATGILMEREAVDAETAFAMIRQASQNHNIKLRDIAAELVRSTEQKVKELGDS